MSREVLSPPLMRMGPNRCYRVNLVHEDFGGPPTSKTQQQPQATGYTEQDLYGEDDDGDDDEENSCTIEELQNSMFKLTMHVPQALYGGLIGFKGSTKRRIESETRTDIYVPRSREGGGGNKNEDVTIKGKSRASVCSARRKINMLIISLRKRMRPTHFLCVPMNYGDVKDNFIKFKNEVLAAELQGIDKDLFQADCCIHLTLGTCVLLDDAERAKAVELLQNCRQHLTDLKTPFGITANGLEIMNDDPSAVRVLYARIEAPVLQEFANRVWQLFLKSHLAKDDFDRTDVKLHMTIMNSRYRRQLNSQSEQNFDGREILKRYGDYHFGSVQCNEVQLCVLHTQDVRTELKEYYKITGALKF